MPGPRAICLRTASGLTNLRIFVVGDLADVVEPEPGTPVKPQPIRVAELPASIHGRILPGEEDEVVFRARRGDRLVARLAARSLIPFIADAVPGWLQVQMQLCDAAGQELARAASWRHEQDPCLDAVIPADGEYRLLLRDSLWRGREDFTYRLDLGVLPLITAVEPRGGSVQAPPPVVRGINLDGARVLVAEDGIQVSRDGLLSNRMPFDRREAPTAHEADLDAERRITKEVLVLDGGIDQPGAVDRFRRRVEAGEILRLDVLARRLGSPLDAVLSVRSANGRLLASNDDAPHQRIGTATHVADPTLVLRCESAGDLRIELADACDEGGADFTYRLLIGETAPPPALVTPATAEIPPGGAAAFVLHLPSPTAYPRTLRLDGDAAGLRVHPARIPPGQDRLLITLVAASDAAAGPRQPRLFLDAGDGSPQTVLFAEDQMQAFLWRHLVPVSRPVILIGQTPAPLRLSAAEPPAITVAPGGRSRLDLSVVAPAMGFIRLQLVDPPPGWSLEKATLNPRRDQVSLILAASAEASRETTVVLQASVGPPTEKPAERAAGDARPQRLLCTMPALSARLAGAPAPASEPEGDIIAIDPAAPAPTTPGPPPADEDPP